MKEKLIKVKEALEHSIRVMEEEVYVTRDQERATVLIDTILAELDSPELVREVAWAIAHAGVSVADKRLLDKIPGEVSLGIWDEDAQAAIDAIKDGI